MQVLSSPLTCSGVMCVCGPVLSCVLFAPPCWPLPLYHCRATPVPQASKAQEQQAEFLTGARPSVSLLDQGVCDLVVELQVGGAPS